jgi:hypothetical protein
LHKVTLEPANQHRIGSLLKPVSLQINEVEEGRFSVATAKNDKKIKRIFFTA